VLKVPASAYGEVVVFSPAGPLIEGGLNEALHRAVQTELAEGLKWVVVDMSRVPWINSSGVGTLMGCRTESLLKGGRFALSGANDRIMNLLNSLQLAKVFDCYSGLEDAVVALGGNMH
jgi:anti-anti-sigma factor